MKKLAKFLVGVIVILIMAVGGFIYALQPEGGIQKDTTGNREMTKEDIIQMSILDSLEYKKETNKFEGSVSFTEEDISNILYTFMKNYDIDDVISNDIKISGKDLIVTLPVDIEFIHTQAEVSILPSVENGNLIADIENVKLGKINLPKSIISKIIASQKDEIPFEIRDTSIIISKETLSPIQLIKVYVEENELKIDMRLNLKDAMQYVYGNFIKPAV